jgi:competence protein ComEC
VRVREATPARLVNDTVGSLRGVAWWFERARYHLRDSIKSALASKFSAAAVGVLVALVVGDQGAIGAQWWTVFNQTGVGHLMSISGLHVTMMAGFVATLAMAIWKFCIFALSNSGQSQACLYVPTKQWVRWCACIAGAWGYTALAGFGIPAQRTCWMVTLAALAALSGRSGSAVSVILFTASAVIFIDPWAVLSAGFWLSFGAVSAIIYFGSARHFTVKVAAIPNPEGGRSGRVNFAAGTKLWLANTLSNGWQSQVAATISLLPIGAAFFSSFALLSPVANAIAIPLVSALVTPLAIVGGMLSFVGATIIGNGLLWLGAALTAPLLEWLQWLATLPGSVAILGKPGLLVLLVGMCGMLWLLAPLRSVPWQFRGCGLLALLPIFFQIPQTPPSGEALLTTFDVGQGSAVLIETKNRRLVFDLGPSYGPDSDAGSAVIVPYLRARGFKEIDGLVLSHFDADHIGGLRGVLGSVSVGWVASSIPASENIWRSAPKRFFACRRGDVWEWDGVRFEFMYPDLIELKKPGTKSAASLGVKSNSSSCVLKVSAKGVSALLTADIEANDERKILKKTYASNLQADVLFVPNHGSKTSSSEPFVGAVSPKLAIFQLGFRNRFKYPDTNVLQRYKDEGIAIHRTDELGAIGIQLPSLEVTSQRSVDSPYWRTRLGASLHNHDFPDD